MALVVLVEVLVLVVLVFEILVHQICKCWGIIFRRGQMMLVCDSEHPQLVDLLAMDSSYKCCINSRFKLPHLARFTAQVHIKLYDRYILWPVLYNMCFY